jgi:hypothetical protein
VYVKNRTAGSNRRCGFFSRRLPNSRLYRYDIAGSVARLAATRWPRAHYGDDTAFGVFFGLEVTDFGLFFGFLCLVLHFSFPLLGWLMADSASFALHTATAK